MATQTQETTRTVQPWQQAQSGQKSAVLGMDTERLARGLGWYSIGLGLTELLAPRAIARLTGTTNHQALIRSYGLREIAHGVAILNRPRSAAAVWSRVPGDALDLASLGRALASPRNDRGKTIGAMAAVAGTTAVDVLCALKLSRVTGGATRAEANIIINKSVEECYRFWHDFENLPRFMNYLQSVRITGDTQSHWVARAPGDFRVEWDAEIESDVPNERITWHSTPGSQVQNSGSVEFKAAPGGRGTIVSAKIDYDFPGASAAALAKVLGKDPEQIVKKDLHRFKQVIETGEVIRTEGQPAGRRSSTTWLDSVAR
ncbi:MAG: hypothetical protein QOJ99_933 [Bryobacterales bacterium]|nr:hypothetical protein [Bryobacterales bacterium]